MDGTLFVARTQDQSSGGHALYFWVRSAPIVGPTSHPWRTHLPSIRLPLLHQRYAISADHVRYGEAEGFISGTLFALIAFFNMISFFNRCLGGGVGFIHERRRRGAPESSHARGLSEVVPSATELSRDALNLARWHHACGRKW